MQNKALRFMEDKRETKGKQIEDTWETKGGPRQQQAEDRWKRSRIQGTKKLMDDKGDKRNKPSIKQPYVGDKRVQV